MYYDPYAQASQHSLSGEMLLSRPLHHLFHIKYTVYPLEAHF